MNTVEKGNLFETQSLEIVKQLIENGDLGLMKDYVRIFRKKKYPTSKRNGVVEFDLTIEVWPPNSQRYSMIYFIECKNYDSRIPIDKLKKFNSDILEVSGINAKPIFIANSQFQQGAYDYAESIGMMLIQADSVESYKIILHKRSHKVENKIDILKETINIVLLDEGVRNIEKIIDKEIFNSLHTNNISIGYGLDKLSKEQIEEIATNELNKINSHYLTYAEGISFKNIEEYLNKAYNLRIEFDSKKGILGACDIENKIIYLNKSLKNSNRLLFILCHEFGHYMLHQKLIIDQQTYDSFEDSSYSFKSDKYTLENPRQWIEWQANYFSISFLLPKSSILAKLWHYQLKKGLPKSQLYFDDQYSNQKNFHNILYRLAIHFEVSKTSILYRLKEINHFANRSRLKSVKDLISDFREEYFA